MFSVCVTGVTTELKREIYELSVSHRRVFRVKNRVLSLWLTDSNSLLKIRLTDSSSTSDCTSESSLTPLAEKRLRHLPKSFFLLSLTPPSLTISFNILRDHVLDTEPDLSVTINVESIPESLSRNFLIKTNNEVHFGNHITVTCFLRLDWEGPFKRTLIYIGSIRTCSRHRSNVKPLVLSLYGIGSWGLKEIKS